MEQSISPRVDGQLLRGALEARACNDRARHDLLPRAIECLDKLVSFAQQGKYQLASIDQIFWPDYVTDMSRALAPFEYAVPVSSGTPFQKPSWMTWASYFRVMRKGHCFRTELVTQSLELSVGDVLREKYYERLQEHLGEVQFRGLFDDLWQQLTMSIWRALWTAVLYNPIGDIGNSGLMSLITYFIGFALAGDEEVFEDFLPLMRRLPQAIPLGRKIHEDFDQDLQTDYPLPPVNDEPPNTWLVLTA